MEWTNEQFTKGPTDLVQAERDDLAARRLFVGDTPPQIHLGEVDVPLDAHLSDLWEHFLHQEVALGLHVPERQRSSAK